MRRFLIIFTLLTVTMASSLAFFYWGYERYSLILIYRENVYYEKANAIKHATAAAETYLFIAPLVGEESAETVILVLGKFSEYFEKTVRLRHRDSPAELLKDMHNNQVGITTAQWYQRIQPKDTIRQTIRLLADKGGLVPSASAASAKLPPSLAYEEGYRAIHDVNSYFQSKRTEIIHRTEALLESLNQ